MRFIFLISDFRIRNLKRGSNQETYSKEKKREVKKRCDGGILVMVMCFHVVKKYNVRKKNANHHVFLLTNMGSCYGTRVFVCVQELHTILVLCIILLTHTHTQYICSKVGLSLMEAISTFVHSVNILVLFSCWKGRSNRMHRIYGYCSIAWWM